MKLIAPLIYLFCSVIFWNVSSHRGNFFYEQLETFSVEKILSIMQIFTVWLMVYGWIVIKKEPVKFKWIYVISIVFIFLSFPWASRDTAAYMTSTRNLWGFHLNPYKTEIGTNINPWSVFIDDVFWAKNTSSYGPVFWFITWPIVFSPNIIGAIWIYKIIVLLAFGISVYFFKKLLEVYKIDKSVLWLFLLNPAILFHTIGDCHNEIFVLMFLLTSVYFLKKHNWGKGLFFWILSVFIKEYTLVLLPIMWKNKNKISIKNILISMSILVVTLIGNLWIWGINLGQRYGEMSFIKNRCIYKCSAIIAITNFFPTNWRFSCRIILFGLIGLIILYHYFGKKFDELKYIFWILMALFFVYTTWLTPWYPVLIIPFGLLLGGKYKYFSLGLTIYSMLHYFGI